MRMPSGPNLIQVLLGHSVSRDTESPVPPHRMPSGTTQAALSLLLPTHYKASTSRAALPSITSSQVM